MMFLLMANEDDVLRWMMYFEGVQLKKGARRDSERAKKLAYVLQTLRFYTVFL